MKKAWSGRFKRNSSALAESFTESVSFDSRLWKYDISGSIAHTRMLARQNIISKKDSARILKGLSAIADEFTSGTFKVRKELEDIHMNIEAALIKKIGPVGMKLHTARSRNDQISLDMRMYLKEETREIAALIRKTQKTLLKMSERHLGSIMPGYTHLQRAQPVLLSHHLLAYVEMLQRDVSRFKDCFKRIDVLPLGSCAISGTTLPIDRSYVAKLLGFKHIAGNSIDAVSDRDFMLEFLACSSLVMMHLSRLSEELILWSTEEFNFVELPDEYTTGSSIMPQKKNPDVPELVRAKTGRVYGNVLSILTLMKGLPLAYNRDLQEDKPPVFDTVDTVKSCLEILCAMLPHIIFHTKTMLSSAGTGYTTATDIAEYLVKKNIPFRMAHEITGKIVLYCMEKNIQLHQLSIKQLKAFSPVFQSDILQKLEPAVSVQAHSSPGGTATSSVMRQIRKYKKLFNEKSPLR